MQILTLRVTILLFLILLVKALRIPKPFLRKILQLLTKNGFVKSYKGMGGGFSLAIPADKLYIVEVAKVFQGSLNLNECFLKKMACPNRKACPLKKKINKIERNMISELGSITIGQLLKG